MATRIERLARPNPNLLKFPDRRSVYWLDELPAKSERPTTVFELTSRWSQPSERKKISTHYEDNRESPEWKVGAATLKASPSERVCSLARPRQPAVGWQPDRPLLTTYGMGVRTIAKASPRICQLAQPKKSRMPLTPAFNSTNSCLTLLPQAKPSSHIHLLAIPKKEHPHYRPNQPVSSHVPRSVLEAVASERLQVLAIPKPRKTLFEGFDPYKVSLAARVATASPRIQELSQPPARRCRTTSAQDE
ncbi:theg spermatid protein [Ictalurus furcatus]|uniref:theg spermatid protein n=1 Tax=Ictalurus furcatus TaxID=66913 RepID=UPI002350FE90|nr:theg spermatid protein [Ictalurus furcatus]XP_053507948.1 theg spermatid protein [Ictalurus furcatus]XP_053507949.1 theg spermatid protein [Ictalurus furcatus]XP_053507950.1 theg spermatid protein [Ictalurus furcatus]XP_053507952.1 theg spermatid protein [Ictalurus furcatus]